MGLIGFGLTFIGGMLFAGPHFVLGVIGATVGAVFTARSLERVTA